MQNPTGLDRPAATEAVEAPAAPAAPLFRRFDPSRLADRIPSVLALGVGLAWIVGLWVVFSLAPAPDPAEPVGLLAVLVGEALVLSLLFGFVGLGMRRRWGLGVSLFGGAVLLFGAVACQLGGHTGTWLAAQYVAGGALASFSWGGLKAT